MSASVTVTDIESSTQQSETNAEAYATALLQHNELIRCLVNVHNGHELCTEGDSFTLIFHNAGDGLAFGLDLQRALLHLEYPVAYTNEGLVPDADHGKGGKSSVLACCREERDEYGRDILFRGLRVRIGHAFGVLCPSISSDDDHDSASKSSVI